MRVFGSNHRKPRLNYMNSLSTASRRISTLVLALMSCSLVRAADEAEFALAVREAHARLEQKCLFNVRIQESFVQYVNDNPSPPRHNHYIANSETYLIRTWTVGATDGFVERIVINRPDGRYIIGKRASGEYVLGGYVVAVHSTRMVERPESRSGLMACSVA